MKKDWGVFKSQQFISIYSYLIVLSFCVSAFFRLLHLNNDFYTVVNETDDWGRYAAYASDIKQNGVLLPLVQGAYYAPAGFLYNYFLAACFLIFGENPLPVYFIQSLFLGLSVYFLYRTFRDKMKPLFSFLFLLLMTAYAYLDIFKYYTFRLLSENLALLTVSLFFFCFISGFEKNKMAHRFLSAVFLGLTVLTRPNIFPFALLVICVLCYMAIKKQIQIKQLVFFGAVFFMSMSFLLVRNLLSVNVFSFLPGEGMLFVSDFIKHPGNYYLLFFNKIRFCFGFLYVLNPVFQWRPHWTFMWLGYFMYLFLKIKYRDKTCLWELVTHFYIVVYFLTLIFFTQVESYGFRMLLPLNFIVLLFSVMFLDVFCRKNNVSLNNTW